MDTKIMSSFAGWSNFERCERSAKPSNMVATLESNFSERKNQQ